MVSAEDRALAQIELAERRRSRELDISYLGLETLPEAIRSLTGLESLRADRNRLTTLPRWLNELTRLEALSVNGNRLAEPPEVMQSLTGLIQLSLGGNKSLNRLPEWIGALTRLQILDLDDTGLTELPANLRALINLSTLTLSGNRLTELPEWIGSLTNLHFLRLQKNELTELPVSMRSLDRLRLLALAHNPLKALPEWLESFRYVIWLWLDAGQLATIPGSFTAPSSLRTLDVDGRRSDKLPDAIRRFTAIKHLNLHGFDLSTLPDWLDSLPDLDQLSLNGNRLATLPDSLRSLTKLTSLNLSNNRISEIPEWISELVNLGRLSANSNLLTQVPASIGSLDKLNILRLNHNKLASLPDTIGALTDLTELSVKNNRLARLPRTLGALAELEILDIAGNPLTEPPPEVVAGGSEAVLAFLRDSFIAPPTRLWESKLLVVGEATVGKTSLAKQLTGGVYDPGEKQTHGVHIDTLSLAHPAKPDTRMTLRVWDFGGQLEYRATQRFYLTDRSLFLLVWNARARWQDGKLTAWLDVIKARAPQSPVLVVATHLDDASAATLPDDLQERYPQIAGFHRVDAKSGNGIGELREAIREQSARLPLMGVTWPTNWARAAQAVRDLDGYSTSIKHVWDAMAKAGALDPVARQAVIRILHDLGDVVYFADDTELNQKVILHPEWLDARITAVLDSEPIAEAHGVMTRSERDRLWAELDPDLQDRLIRMMERFDLAYRVGDADRSEHVALVVERLGYTRPKRVDELWERARRAAGMREIGFVFKLASRQAGIPTWFIARQHRYTADLHWTHGVLLHDRNPGHPAYALVVDDGREQPTVTFRVRGRFPVHFMSVLIEAFEHIVEQHYPSLIEAKLVPCACQDAAPQSCGHAFDLEELLAELDDPDPDADHKVRCPRSRRKLEARIMLDGLRGSGISKQLDDLQYTVGRQTDSLAQLERSQLATLNGIRALLAHRAQTGEHCPSLFAVEDLGPAGLLQRRRLRISLWCEWPYAPDGPHPLDGEQGTYTISSFPQWLRDYLPFLNALVATLGIAVPLIGPLLTVLGVDLDSPAAADLDLADKALKSLAKASTPDDEAAFWEPSAGSRPRPAAEVTADFRTLRRALRRLDPQELWGGLSPAIRPEDDTVVYLCDKHLRDFDYPYRRSPAGGIGRSAPAGD